MARTRIKRIRWNYKTKNKLCEGQNYLCCYCGGLMLPLAHKANPFNKNQIPPNYPTIEHIIPLGRGGTDTLDNIKIACYNCNHDRDKHAKASNFFWYIFLIGFCLDNDIEIVECKKLMEMELLYEVEFLLTDFL